MSRPPLDLSLFEAPPSPAWNTAPAPPGEIEPYRPASWDQPSHTPGEAIQRRHEESLMRHDGILGVGIGRSGTGAETLRVYVRDEQAGRVLPESLDGLPIEAVVTGPIRAR